MKLLRSIMIFMLTLGLAVSITACSGGSNQPVNPDIADMPESFGAQVDEGRNIIAAYDVIIDPVAETVEMVPAREGAFHFPLSNLYPNCVAITGFNFGPPFWADIRLTHPMPGSGIDGYDPRLIVALPANEGVRFIYPSFYIMGNNKALLDPVDGYTPLFNPTGIQGNVNPFIAYFKDQPFRVWSSTGVTEETKRLTLDLNGFGGPLVYQLIVDVSTNYPAPPQPVVDNIKEPAEIISVDVGSGMTAAGGNATIDVTILDWQGPAEPTTIRVEGPALYNGTVTLNYAGPGPGADQYVYTGTISNDKNAPEGDYTLMIAGHIDANPNLVTYQEFKDVATVGDPPEPGSWALDPNRGNIDAMMFTQPPKAGSDLAVINGNNPDWNGVMMFDDFNQVTRVDLNLTDAEPYGYAYLPWDLDSANPHPNPNDPMEARRISGAANGFVFRTFFDDHQGLGPDSNGNFQRCDSAVIMSMPMGGFLEALSVIYVGPSDNPNTPDYDESQERPMASNVWSEADTGNQLHVQGIMWSGTQLFDIENNLWNPVGLMGAFQEPYFDGSSFVLDWGLWIVTGPPFNEIQGIDASQDLIFPMQFWAYSGPGIGPGLVAWYDKDINYYDSYLPSDSTANILDFELIPLQSPPLQVNGTTQYNDWGVVLLDNKTIEVFDPFMPGGELIEVIDLSGIYGDAAYISVDDSNADIYISHEDLALPYLSVFVLN